MTNGSLMKVESITECILQYFWPALSDNWSWKTIIGIFESGRFSQVLLYYIWAATWDFQQCGILTWIDSEEMYSLLLSIETANDVQSVA